MTILGVNVGETIVEGIIENVSWIIILFTLGLITFALRKLKHKFECMINCLKNEKSNFICTSSRFTFTYLSSAEDIAITTKFSYSILAISPFGNYEFLFPFTTKQEKEDTIKSITVKHNNAPLEICPIDGGYKYSKNVIILPLGEHKINDTYEINATHHLNKYNISNKKNKNDQHERISFQAIHETTEAFITINNIEKIQTKTLKIARIYYQITNGIDIVQKNKDCSYKNNQHICINTPRLKLKKHDVITITIERVSR